MNEKLEFVDFARDSLHSLYMPVEINNTKLEMLIDTGSPVTLLAENIIESLGVGLSDLSKVESTLSAADGNKMSIKGQIKVNLKIDQSQYRQNTIVTKLGKLKGIIGKDFLQSNKCDLKLSEAKLVIGQQTVKLRKHNNSTCARVKLCKNRVIPPQTEILIKGYIEGNCPNNFGMIEPDEKLQQQKGLLFAKTLNDTTGKEVVISVLNINGKSIKLKKNLTLGIINTVQLIDDNFYSDNSESRAIPGSLPTHLQELLQNSSDELTSENKQKLEELLIEFQDIFVGPDGKLGQTGIVKHTINTGTAKPVRVPPRRIPTALKPVVEKELDSMLRKGVIEPSNSAWSSPICLVKKKDGSIRFCVDFRLVNSLGDPSGYPLPNIVDCLDSLKGSKWMSTVDCHSGYWQVLCEESDRPKTAFSTHKGLFQFRVMPMGLNSAAQTFQRLIETILGKLQWIHCLCYLDDIIIFGKT